MASTITRRFNAIGGWLLVRSGRVGVLGTTGAKSGKAREAPLGFVARPDGTILVGSGSPVNRGWTANLKADPSCTFAVRGAKRHYRARLVELAEREAVLAELRAAMGSVAERANWGDLFILEPVG